MLHSTSPSTYQKYQKEQEEEEEGHAYSVQKLSLILAGSHRAMIQIIRFLLPLLPLLLLLLLLLLFLLRNQRAEVPDSGILFKYMAKCARAFGSQFQI